MYQSQLLKIRIRPGKTPAVLDFLRSLQEREDLSLEAMRREGMVVENMFLERRDDGDYLYYYAKARDLARAAQVNMQATDALSMEIRNFIAETWDHIASPEPVLDLDLIREQREDRDDSTLKSRPRRKAKASVASGSIPAVPAPHALIG